MATERRLGVYTPLQARLQPCPHVSQAVLDCDPFSLLPSGAVETLAGLPLAEPAGTLSLSYVGVCSTCSRAWLG